MGVNYFYCINKRMSDFTNHVSDPSSSTVGGVLSIQERIRAMNETLDTVEQRQKKQQQQQPTKDTTMENLSASTDMESIQNEPTISGSEHFVSTPPAVKRSSVIAIWRMRENQNVGGATATTKTDTTISCERKTPQGGVSKKIAASLLRPNVPTRVGGIVNPWNSQSSVEGQEEKKEDCDDFEVPPVGKGVSIRTVASASPTPPILPGSNRKNPKHLSTTSKSYHHPDVSPQEKLVSKKNSYPVVDLSIVQSTSSLSTSSGTKQFVSQKLSTLSSNNENASSKIAMIRDKLVHNTTTTTATSNSAPSFSVGSTVTDEIPEQPSYEDKLISAFVQQSPSVTLSPKRQSVVDIWKNRTVPATMDDALIETNGQDAVPDVGLDEIANSSVMNQKPVSGPDCETNVTNCAGQVIVTKNESTAAVQSPTRNNTGIADRWARRLADQKGSTITNMDDNVPVITNDGRAATKGVNTFAAILTDTFSADRPNICKSNESDPGLDSTPPPSNTRKGKVTDRYKVTSTTSPSIKHMVSPMISSLVKEHAARTPVLPYKNRKENLPEMAPSETIAINVVPPSKSSETQAASPSHRNINSYVVNTVMTAVDKQAEKRHQKVTDRWNVHNGNIATGSSIKGKDTLDIPVSYGKVTDRYMPKNKTSASEPGISRFDSATVAELLKLHAGNTPAGKVRGGIKHYSSDGRRGLMKNVTVADDTHRTCFSTASEVSPPRRSVTDRWTARSTTIDETKVLPSKSNEALKANLNPSQLDMNDTDISPTAVMTSLLPEPIIETVEIEPPLDISPGMSSKSDIADRWKKRLGHTKESDHISPSGRSFQSHIQCQTQEDHAKISMGNIGNKDQQVSAIALDVANQVTTILGHSQMTQSKAKESINLPVTSSLNSSNDFGQTLNGQQLSVTGLDSRKLRLPDEIVDAVVTPIVSKHVNVPSTIPKLPPSGSVEYEKLVSSQPRPKDVGSVKLTNSSAFDRWNNPIEVSREGSMRTSARTMAAPGTNDGTDHTFHQVNMPLDVGLVIESEYSTLPDVTQSTNSLASLNVASRCEIDDCLGHDKETIVIEKSIAVAVKTHDREKSPLPNPNATITLSTKKLASDRASNKKRLQQYRGKAKKTLSSKIDSTRIEVVEDDSSKSESKPSYSSSDNFDSRGHVSYIPSTTADSKFDLNNLLQSSGNETEQSSKPGKTDFDREAVDIIFGSASTSSSSPLASKAERMLQDRRRRSKGENVVSHQLPSTAFSAGPLDKMLQKVVDEESTNCDRNGYFCSDRPRLSTRYNTSDRFLETDTPTSEPAIMAYDSDSVESSCNESGNTSGSNSGYRQEERRKSQESRASSKLRKNSLKDPPGQVSNDKSVNLSSHSNWDSDWGGNVSMVSMDFDKFVAVVDEQVAAFRDFVGGGIQRHITQKKGKSNSRKPFATNVPTEVEDVAIEVEYVEDSFDDDDPNADLGLCTAPVDDIVRKSLNFSDGSKAKTCGAFQMSCNEMLPTGEPSCERKPNTRNQNKRNVYV